MNRLHLSSVEFPPDTFTNSEQPSRRPSDPVPACGADDGIHTMRRGFGDGLVPPAAISAEFHCPDCVAAIRKGANR